MATELCALRPRADRDRAPAAGLGRAGPGRLVDVGGRRVRRGARDRAVGLRGDRRDRLLGRTRDVRALRRRAAAAHRRDPLVGRPRRARAPALGDPIDVPRRDRRGAERRERMPRSSRGWRATAPDALDRARWILQPRDFVVARMTGVVVTDESLASRTGLYALDATAGSTTRVATYGERLPPIVAPTAIVGEVAAGRGRAARASGAVCVVIAARATARARCSGPARRRTRRWCRGGRPRTSRCRATGPVDALPVVAAVSRGALEGFVVEAGLSAAGAAVAWLASLTGRTHDDLFAAATAVDSGRRRRGRAAVVRRRARPVVAPRRARRVHRSHRRARRRPSSRARSSRASRSTSPAASSSSRPNAPSSRSPAAVPPRTCGAACSPP